MHLQGDTSSRTLQHVGKCDLPPLTHELCADCAGCGKRLAPTWSSTQAAMLPAVVGVSLTAGLQVRIGSWFFSGSYALGDRLGGAKPGGPALVRQKNKGGQGHRGP